jgi:hypothetical protein
VQGELDIATLPEFKRCPDEDALVIVRARAPSTRILELKELERVLTLVDEPPAPGS